MSERYLPVRLPYNLEWGIYDTHTDDWHPHPSAIVFSQKDTAVARCRRMNEDDSAHHAKLVAEECRRRDREAREQDHAAAPEGKEE